ncbi:MAG TPA: hypothetical protein VFO18_05095 [Methylomirabilota bacterium]|nr:hypothetical protein [Methylomirabilota bacterium]
MRLGFALLVLFCVLVLPVIVVAGQVSLRALGWLALAALILAILIDLNDRLWEWIQRKRWPGSRL